MERTTKIKLVIYFIGFILPILGMMNCQGWNEGSGVVSDCIIDCILFRSYADFYYGLLLISTFMVLIPLGIYSIIVIFLANFLSKRL